MVDYLVELDKYSDFVDNLEIYTQDKHANLVNIVVTFLMKF